VTAKRRAAIVVLIVTIGSAVTGCAVPQAITEVQSPQLKSSPAKPDVTADVPDGIVATGHLVTPSGEQTGSVVITHDGAKFVANLVGFSTDVTDQKSVSFSPDVLAPADCVSNRYVLSWADGDTLPENTMEVGLLGDSGDPSYLRSVVVNRYPIGKNLVSQSTPDCYEPTIATAVLTWTLPDMRPGLGPIVDGGPDAAALGIPTDEGETTVSYRTAAGDTLRAIARRFGVSTDDLTYLNPRRPGVYDPDTAYTDEVLNLDKERR